MSANRRWMVFDTFKLIVALILALLILALSLPEMLRVSSSPGGQTEPPAGIVITPSPPPQVGVTAPATSPPPSPTPTGALAAIEPTSSPAGEQAVPTETEMVQATELFTAPPSTPAAPVDCPRAQPPRLSVGQKARVTANLNLRSEAGMENPVINVSLPGTVLEITGGPVCLPYQDGAYLWWNVSYSDGQSGWSAEAALYEDFYFLEPVQ